ncbi:MAG: MBOAT family O-acyltransferase [Lachnospiraceae bacterium]
MVFSSFTFLFAFLPAVLLLYFICPKKFRNFILLAFSLLFYAWGEPIYVCIMLFSTVFDYVNGLLIGKFRENENEKAAKAVLIASVVINLGILCFFKYTDFFITNVNTLTGSGLNLLGIALPIGISFYTFQTLSYTIDVYRGNVEVQHNIINFGTYVTLFPQLIAGPIVQYKTVEEDLNNRRISIPEISKGIQRFLIGLGKKVLIANQVGAIWEQVHKMVPQEMSVLTAWVGILAFTFQIYFDFSGYSDMAIGLGHVFGFRFLENFEHPYESRSITEFWRRWHISLGAWFREYLYIPLGGNRVSVPRHILNLFIVWFLTGFWHGSSWNFVAWGLYFFVILILEKYFLLKRLQTLPAIVGHVYSVLLIVFGWVLFANESFAQIGGYFAGLFGASGMLFDSQGIYLLQNSALILLIAAIGSTQLLKKSYHYLMKRFNKHTWIIQRVADVCGILLFLLCVAHLAGDTYNPFLYFRF